MKKKLSVSATLMMLAVGAAAAAQEPAPHRILNVEKAAPADFAFYNGTLNWNFQSAFNVLNMIGYASTTNGGVVSQVTGCLYNQSPFVSTFTATASVVQNGTTIQAITFATTFAALTSTCHTLTGFNATVAPGAFELWVSYDPLQSDNVFLGLPATDSGQVFDVQIGSARPPTANGPQGPISMHGVGIKYRFTESDTPPPPPPPPTCTPSDTALCLNNGRFRVEAAYTAPGQPTGDGHGVKLTDATGYFWFFDNTNVEVIIKVLDACVAPYNHYWVFAGGLTNVAVTLTVTDTMNGTVKVYNNPQKTQFQPIQDTAAFNTCP